MSSPADVSEPVAVDRDDDAGGKSEQTNCDTRTMQATDGQTLTVVEAAEADVSAVVFVPADASSTTIQRVLDETERALSGRRFQGQSQKQGDRR